MTAGTAIHATRHGVVPCDHCDAQIQAAEIIAASHDRMTVAIERATTRITPLVNATASFLENANQFCRFAKRWTVPAFFVLVLSGAITPDMAKGFHNLLRVVGAAQ